LEHHSYHGKIPRDTTKVLADVLDLHGSMFRNALCIVASPPCQEPSYRAMPWKRAKALNAIGPPHLFIELFNACFRIQREASEAAGHYIPLIVENVCGAQAWVGRARWHFGSYYLWGDVPALMPISSKLRKSRHVPSCETPSGTGKTSWFFGNSKHKGRFYGTASGKGQNPDGRKGIPYKPTGHWTNPEENGTKQGGDWFGKNCETSMSRLYGSKSKKRKAASAEIAKIPFPLAQHIARTFKPRLFGEVSA
jgi:hypothetical protein